MFRYLRVEILGLREVNAKSDSFIDAERKAA